MKYSRNVRLLFAVAFLQGLVFYSPIATLYRQAAGVSVFQLTLIESISTALALLLELPWGIAADRLGYKKTLVINCLLFAVSKVVFWQADSFGAFLLERILLSVVIAGLSGVDSSVLYLSCKEEESQKVFGLYASFGTAGLLTASAVYSLFIGSNYRLAGFLTVLSYSAAAALVFLLDDVQPAVQEEKPGPARDFTNALGALGGTRGLLPFLLAAALLCECSQTITVFLCQVQYALCGMSGRLMGVACLLATLCSFAAVFSDKATRLLGEKRLGISAFLMGALCCAILAFTKSALLSVAAVLLLRTGVYLYSPMEQAIENRLITSSQRATALSVNALVMDGVAIVTNLLFGRLADASLPAAMGLGSVLCFAGLGLFLLGYSRMSKRKV